MCQTTTSIKHPPSSTVCPSANANPSASRSNVTASNANIYISQHPIIQHQISLLRSILSTSNPAHDNAHDVSSMVRQLTLHLGSQATLNLSTRQDKFSMVVPDPAAGQGIKNVGKNKNLAESVGTFLSHSTCLISINDDADIENKVETEEERDDQYGGGYQMCNAMMDLLPHAHRQHVSVPTEDGTGTVSSSDSSTATPCNDNADENANLDVNVKGNVKDSAVYICIPSICNVDRIGAVLDRLQESGVHSIHIIAIVGSAEGLATLATSYPNVFMTVGCLLSCDHTSEDDIIVDRLSQLSMSGGNGNRNGNRSNSSKKGKIGKDRVRSGWIKVKKEEACCSPLRKSEAN